METHLSDCESCIKLTAALEEAENERDAALQVQQSEECAYESTISTLIGDKDDLQAQLAATEKERDEAIRRCNEEYIALQHLLAKFSQATARIAELETRVKELLDRLCSHQ